MKNGYLAQEGQRSKKGEAGVHVYPERLRDKDATGPPCGACIRPATPRLVSFPEMLT